LLGEENGEEYYISRRALQEQIWFAEMNDNIVFEEEV
jgi:hypothetical protein